LGVSPGCEGTIQTVGKCDVEQRGVRVGVVAGWLLVESAEGGGEVDAAGFVVVAEPEEVVADAVAVDYRHS
jgi:hypothetical protein